MMGGGRSSLWHSSLLTDGYGLLDELHAVHPLDVEWPKHDDVEATG
jgi:hypothetical protein